MEFKQKEKELQALILADSFTNTCRPISLETPKVLFPLCQSPMLAYVLEFLEASGVKEAFVFCSSFADEVETFISKSKFGSGVGDMSVRVIKVSLVFFYFFILNSLVVSTYYQILQSNPDVVFHCPVFLLSFPHTNHQHESCQSAGDAIREVQSREVLVSEPFVLISGDVICNVDLVEVIDQHKRRRKKDKECIMTMIFKQAPSTCRTRSLGDDLVVALDGKDNRILKYLDNPSESNVEFDVPCFKDHTSVQFRYDLLDCNVDVCSLSMVDRIADEYDVQDLRKHFITREVADRELGLKIHGHVVTHQYAARVFDPRTYDSIASDVVRRWAYPFTIDSNFLNFGTSSFVCSRGNRYKESGVQVGTNTIVGPNTVVGSDTTIGDHVSIQASTFGSNCTIGNGAKIQGSHLWNNVTVGENATIDRAIVCEGVVVRKGATVSRGCVLSFGVVIDEGVFVPEFTRLTRVPRQLVQRRVSALEGWDDTYGESDEDEGNTEAGSGEFDWNQLLADMVRCEHVEVNTWKTWSMLSGVDS